MGISIFFFSKNAHFPKTRHIDMTNIEELAKVSGAQGGQNKKPKKGYDDLQVGNFIYPGDLIYLIS